MIDSPQFILIDNVRSRLSSAALSAVLTATIWTDRLLGQSKMVTLPVNCVWLATANNPALSLEVARRTVSTRIDSREERPWDRKDFRHPDLRVWAQEHRGELIWAALTLVNGWMEAGKPSGTGTLGSCESWASVMGGILEVGEIAGFLGNKDRVYNAAEQETLAWAEFCSEWWSEFQDRPVGTDLLFGLAYRHRLLLEVWGGRDDHSAHTRFGKALSKMKDRVVGGYRVCRDERDSHNKGQRFHLENLRNVRNVAEPFAGPESRSTRTSDTAQRALLAVEAATLGRENPPQPPALTPGTSFSIRKSMDLAERVRRGQQAIVLAEVRGLETAEWRRHLQELLDAAGRMPGAAESFEPWALWEWRRVSIPEWRVILATSVEQSDRKREEHARWMLSEVLLDPGYDETRKYES